MRSTILATLTLMVATTLFGQIANGNTTVSTMSVQQCRPTYPGSCPKGATRPKLPVLKPRTRVYIGSIGDFVATGSNAYGLTTLDGQECHPKPTEPKPRPKLTLPIRPRPYTASVVTSDAVQTAEKTGNGCTDKLLFRRLRRL
jgi:hypothetical protein